MIVSKTPLRITLAGGGTDLPSYYRKNSGYVISLAIDKFIYISINKTFVDYFQLKYSKYEKVKNIKDIIKIPIVRDIVASIFTIHCEILFFRRNT